MITDALDGKIDLIITKSLSIFARNTVDALNVIRKLKVNNIGVYFEKEDIDTLDAGVPVLSMHAPFETVGKLDCYMTYKGMKAVFEAV